MIYIYGRPIAYAVIVLTTLIGLKTIKSKSNIYIFVSITFTIFNLLDYIDIGKGSPLSMYIIWYLSIWKNR